ncbi:alpha/beta hydrolase [Nitriliruptor alkaliphilus]|uniref:alpha/beta hydrolase n=1 Tax=Nitriliruptor alkaliphilus TaxID=427918 RepID=UPI000695F083|nr:alpha/beta hydrolase [Nitriliruptor alkaliphilus]
MSVGAWFLAVCLVGVWFTWQALRPAPLPTPRAVPSFFAGWLTNELAGHHLVWQAVTTALFVAAGALRTWPGWVALALVVAQWIGLVSLLRDARRAREVVDTAVTEALGPGYRDELPTSDESWDRIRTRGLVVPFTARHPRVVVERDRCYGRAAATDLRLDVFAPRDHPARGDAIGWAGGRPAIIYVHGGAWTLGYRDRQGGPLLTEMAARGWVGIRPGYRLSPAATFPDHLVDVKRAIVWMRDHADELGVDPTFVAIAGGSAGGHLAALVALTAGRADLQPGFEAADTSVQACVPFYGVYDVAGDDALRSLLARYVLKCDPDEDPHRWATFAPMRQLRADAPPFLVVHGARDTLTSPSEARRFAAALGEVSDAPVGYAELPGAQHAFDVFPSLRTANALRGVARFLAVTHTRASGPIEGHDRGTDRRQGRALPVERDPDHPDADGVRGGVRSGGARVLRR